jgi:hypothetical protein
MNKINIPAVKIHQPSLGHSPFIFVSPKKARPNIFCRHYGELAALARSVGNEGRFNEV